MGIQAEGVGAAAGDARGEGPESRGSRGAARRGEGVSRVPLDLICLALSFSSWFLGWERLEAKRGDVGIELSRRESAGAKIWGEIFTAVAGKGGS